VVSNASTLFCLACCYALGLLYLSASLLSLLPLPAILILYHRCVPKLSHARACLYIFMCVSLHAVWA
jgi:hypothetical protein